MDVRSLAAALAAIVVAGWLAGIVVTRALGGETLAHVDGPTKVFFAAHQSPALLAAMRDVTVAGSDRVVLPIAVAGGLWWRWRRATWRPLVVLVAAYVGGAFIAVSDKVAVGRDRRAGGGLRAFAGYAFPSGHATQAMAVYGTVAVLAIAATGRPWARLAIGAVAASVILSVALSRLYLGAHWMTDVAAGLGLGGLWVAALATIALAPRPGRGR